MMMSCFKYMDQLQDQLDQLFQQFKQDVMGTTSFQHKNYDLKAHYTKQTHPIQGQVSLYRLKGQSLFLFAIPNQSSLFAKLAQTIERQKHPSLCSYFGNLFMKETINYKKQCLCGDNQVELYTFWTFNNHTLYDQISYNIREDKYPKESELWDLLDCLSQAGLILSNYGLFIDFDFKNVQFSAMSNIELYWGNAKVGNGHRYFYRNMAENDSNVSCGLSPEELAALARKKMAAKFDLGKCVIHSLGRVILLYSNNLGDFSQIIDFGKCSINTQQISILLRIFKSRYSNRLTKIITKMLEEQPSKRASLLELRNLIESESSKTLIERLSSKRGEKANTSPTNTCCSSKVSVRVSEF